MVIPTLDREAFLKDTITDLQAQTHRPIEILIVDQSAQVSPELLALIQDHSEVVSYHRVPFRGSAKARNYGWQQARYDAIVFVDDDIRCGPTFLTQHLRALHLSGVGLVAGAVETSRPQRRTGRHTGRFVKWTATGRTEWEAEGEFECDHAQECNFAVWRKAMVAVGGIDETFDVPAALYEGLDLSLRIKDAGMRVYFNGSARLLHLAAPRGGNRVLDIPRYFWGLAHNRAVIMRRHLRWFHHPVAMARLFSLAMAHTLHYRKAAVLISWLTGYSAGFRAGGRPPYCTREDAKPDKLVAAPASVVDTGFSDAMDASVRSFD